MLYLDTSLDVPLVAIEPNTEIALKWLQLGLSAEVVAGDPGDFP